MVSKTVELLGFEVIVGRIGLKRGLVQRLACSVRVCFVLLVRGFMKKWSRVGLCISVFDRVNVLRWSLMLSFCRIQ